MQELACVRCAMCCVQELALCEEYDWQMNRWEKSVERIETNPKKR